MDTDFRIHLSLFAAIVILALIVYAAHNRQMRNPPVAPLGTKTSPQAGEAVQPAIISRVIYADVEPPVPIDLE